MFLPTTTTEERFSAAGASTASALVRSRWLNGSTLPALFTTERQHPIDSRKSVQNTSHAENISADSAVTRWSFMGRAIETITVKILFAIAATMTLGLLFAIVLCGLLLRIKEDPSQADHLAQRNATLDDPNKASGEYDDAI
jgi:hypothetical protein